MVIYFVRLVEHQKKNDFVNMTFIRGVFETPSNVCDSCFWKKISQLQTVNCFRKKATSQLFGVIPNKSLFFFLAFPKNPFVQVETWKRMARWHIIFSSIAM